MRYPTTVRDCSLASQRIQSPINLLDALDETVDGGTAKTVDVFNLLDCKSQLDFDKYYPGITKVFQSPLLGVGRTGY